MTIFNIHCEDPWFFHIRQGIKTVEGRKGTPSYKKIKAGDRINFSNGTDSFIAVVTEIRDYDSIEKYLEDVSLDKALPGIKTIKKAWISTPNGAAKKTLNNTVFWEYLLNQFKKRISKLERTASMGKKIQVAFKSLLNAGVNFF